MARVTFILEPSGRYAGSRPRQVNLPPSSTLRFSIGSDIDKQDASVADGGVMPIVVVDIHLVTGSLAHAYPHDRALATVIIDAWIERPAGGNGSSKGGGGGGGDNDVTREPVTVVWQATTVMALWDTQLLPAITYASMLRLDNGAKTQLMMTVRARALGGSALGQRGGKGRRRCQALAVFFRTFVLRNQHTHLRHTLHPPPTHTHS
jgi:hypothetical protein